jgi:hypothetical protein
VTNVQTIEILQSSFTFLLSILFFHVCGTFLLHWGSTNNVGFSKAMAPLLQVPKHFKFKLFFNVESNPSIESMADLGSNSTKEFLVAFLKALKSE